MSAKPLLFPAAGFAAIACLLAVFGGLPPLAALALFVVWCLTLWLTAGEPPRDNSQDAPPPLDEAQMGDLFELSEVPILVTRRNRVTVANAAARTLFGDHILDQDIRMALRNPDALGLVDRGENGGATVSGLVRRRDVWRINLKALPGDVGVLEFLDRTAEADIGRAHTDFVANASHELRTPLASIIGYVETLREEGAYVDQATSDRFLSTIQREAKRLQSLVGDLMSLSRIEAEKHEVPTERLDFSTLVERAARDAAGLERLDRLVLAVSPHLAVEGDAQQLEQVVRNLVDNAFQYGDPGQPVTVSADSSDGQVGLIVADRGDGIAAGHLPHLTRRFYRTDPGRSRASGGTGLGLAIVKHVVERHRGKLDIASTAGEGTTVSVRLTAAREV